MVPLILPGCTIDHMTVQDSLLQVTAHADARSAVCPTCQHAVDRVHSRYQRQPHDLPVSTLTVRVCLTVRRFFCLNAACPRRTFAEQFPLLVPVRAQRTGRLTHHLQMPTSPATLLRIIRATPDPVLPPLRVVGVDDFAFRRRHRYSTLVIDLERQKPVDLLPDRSAATLATWLKGHPNIEIITRDRSTEYARGVTAGAPQAQQIADRWHLLVNLREALERMLTRLHSELRRLPPAAHGGGHTRCRR
jgi:transposase